MGAILNNYGTADLSLLAKGEEEKLRMCDLGITLSALMMESGFGLNTYAASVINANFYRIV